MAELRSGKCAYSPPRRKSALPLYLTGSLTMSVVIPASEESISKGSAPVPSPDFSRGQWRARKPYFGPDS
jgi:hypothetical protein